MLNEGDMAPDVTVEDAEGKTHERTVVFRDLQKWAREG